MRHNKGYLRLLPAMRKLAWVCNLKYHKRGRAWRKCSRRHAYVFYLGLPDLIVCGTTCAFMPGQEAGTQFYASFLHQLGGILCQVLIECFYFHLSYFLITQ